MNHYKEKTSNELSITDLLITVNHVFHYFKIRWRKLVLFGAIGAVIGYAYAELEKPLYTATMTFTIDADEQSNNGISGLAAQFGFEVGGKGSLFEGDNIIIFFKSRSMVQKTLLSEDTIDGHVHLLVNDYIRYNQLHEKWSSNSELKNISFKYGQTKLTRLQDSVLSLIYEEIIKKNLIIEKNDKKLSVITLSFVAKNDLFAKSFVEKLSGNVIDFYIKSRIKKSQYNVSILQRQVDSVQLKLDQAVSGVATSLDQQPNANPFKQVLNVPSQRNKLNADASQAVLTELVKNLEISKVALLKNTPLIEFIDQPILPLKVTKVSKVGAIISGFLMGLLLAIAGMIIKRVYSHSSPVRNNIPTAEI
jgi:hypothetical protein